jgi:hypothetical protein
MIIFNAIIMKICAVSGWAAQPCTLFEGRGKLFRQIPWGMPDQPEARERPRGGLHISEGSGGALAAMEAAKQ